MRNRLVFTWCLQNELAAFQPPIKRVSRAVHEGTMAEA